MTDIDTLRATLGDKAVRVEQIGGQTLIQGDCLEVMAALEPVDLVLTDPPFGIKQDKGFGGFGGFGKPIARREYGDQWDATRPPDQAFEMILSLAPVHIIWGGQFFADLLPAQGKWLFWDKCQTMPTYGDGELAWTSLQGNAVKQFTYNGSGLHAKEKERFHPTQKPVALMEWCLNFTPSAKTILDPFAGSGSTGVACVNMGRSFIGIERNEKHFKTMCKRVAEATRQPRLFSEPPPKPTQEGFDL